MRPQDILKEIRKETNEVILFHSLSGKDSIVLIDMTTKMFDLVHCVFMYIVEDLRHMHKYKQFFQNVYNNTIWYEVPHYTHYNYHRLGHLGCKKDAKMRDKPLSKIMNEARELIGLKWIILGSKQSDGLSRRLQLRTYEHEAIDRKHFKCYPLSKWKNAECISYIKTNNLIQHQNYGDNKQSSSNDVTDGRYLTWVKKNYKEDFERIIKIYPYSEIIQFRYENQQK